MASNDKSYMYGGSLQDRVTKYITRGGRPEYQNVTEHPSTLAVYNEPLAKQNGGLGTFEFYINDDGTYTKPVAYGSFKDPYAKAAADLTASISVQAPKVKVNGNRLVIQAPSDVLSSPIVSQIKEELQSLKGSDLESAEVKDALNALNEEVKENMVNWAAQDTFGWTPEEFKDYQYTVQTVSGTNPMKSTNKIKAMKPGGDFYYDEETGQIAEKTPQEWIDYWRKIYNTDERTEMFLKSLVADSPYERTMALVMSQGGEKPIYGYDAAERIGEGLKTAFDEVMLAPKGIGKLVTTWDTKRIDELSKKFNVSKESLLNRGIKDEEALNAVKKVVKGKSWNQLSDDLKAFMLKLGVSRENRHTPFWLRHLGNTPEFDKSKYTTDMASDDEEVSREAISKILEDSTFDEYKNTDNDYAFWQRYEEKAINEPLERQAKNATFASAEQGAGRFAGVLGRIIWEVLGLKGLSGVSTARISDNVGSAIVRGLGRAGISATSNGGKAALGFAGRLAGTIPEDIVQTSIDDIIAYNGEGLSSVLSPDNMSENFKANLIFMGMFNAGMAGVSSVKQLKMLRQLEKEADLNTDINIGAKGSDAFEAARAIRGGGDIEVSDGKVYAIDVNGKRTELKNTSIDEGKMMQQKIEKRRSGAPDAGNLNAQQFENAAQKINKVDSGAASTIDNVAKSSDNVGTVKVEVDTPNGRIETTTADYRINNLGDAVNSKIRVEATPAGVKHWHSRALNAIMRDMRVNMQEFHNRFGDVRASDFDWIWYNTKINGLSPSKIIGTVDPTTNRRVTQNMIDAAKWWESQPFTKRLRMSSRKALGKEADKNVLGYLPHTSYDPSVLPYEEALSGMLWRPATGKSVMKDGDYVGYGGTLEGRYRTFASNMLWDIRNKEVAAARLIEEAEMDGKQLSPDDAMRMVEGGKEIRTKINESPSSKALEKELTSDDGYDKKAYDEANKKVEEEAPKSGVGKAYHDNYANMYIGANTGEVSQPKAVSFSLDTQSNVMRQLKVGNGMSMYDWGGADIVYSRQNAIELVNRYQREGGDFRAVLVDYIKTHSHRSDQYAESVADRWIERIMQETNGAPTKGELINLLGKSMWAEGMSRLRKWLVTAKYDQFSGSSKAFIDNFLFRHLQMESIANNRAIRNKVAGAMDAVVGLRYRALFYGNFKNALLQLSELNRLFTVFKLGDVAKMLKRIATDDTFRDRVDIYNRAIAPETTFLDSELYNKYSNVAETANVGEDSIVFGKIKGTAKEVKETVDKIALAPINAAESMKNKTMIAALVEEADRKGISGDEALMYIRQRFERVALAANEMGKIGLATNPITKPMLFLQQFQMRELGMHYYNIVDATNEATSKPGKALSPVVYLTKVFGSKLGTTLILARLGYSAAQTMGLDPFGVTNNYDRLSDDEKTWIDNQISDGLLTPFVAGGLTSMFSDMYFMAREAYEDSRRGTASEEAEANLDKGAFGGVDLGALVTPSNLWDTGTGFIPGSLFANRVGQMNEMRDSGWATSATGNKMYTAPDNALDTALGYIFGRSATKNALQYNQNYGDDLGQTLNRTIGKLLQNMFTGGYQEFDPIDKKNYSDWFKGDANDRQQFEKGRRYFRSERDRILDEYEKAIRNSYDDDEVAEAKNNMNERLNALYEQLGRFVNAYEKKNGIIDSAMVKQIVSLLNTERRNINDNSADSDEKGLSQYDKALARYAQLGLPAVGTYSGPTTSNPNADVVYQGSPQWRVAKSAKYSLYSEAVDVLKQGDLLLQDIRKALKEPISKAYDRKDYDAVEELQQQYLTAFDKVVGPILATYGSGVLSSSDVADQLKAMLSTGTSSRSADLIPSGQYRKDKRGRYRSMPLESVDVKKWAQQRYSSDTFKRPTIRSYSSTQDDIDEIKRLSAQGNSDMARARALSLKVRVDNQRRSLSKTDYQWLLDFLNKGGQQ